MAKAASETSSARESSSRPPNSRPANTRRFLVHCAGRNEKNSSAGVELSGRATTARLDIRPLHVGGRLEAANRVGFGVVGFEHRQQLSDGKQIGNPLGQVHQ